MVENALTNHLVKVSGLFGNQHIAKANLTQGKDLGKEGRGLKRQFWALWALISVQRLGIWDFRVQGCRV